MRSFSVEIMASDQCRTQIRRPDPRKIDGNQKVI